MIEIKIEKHGGMVYLHAHTISPVKDVCADICMTAQDAENLSAILLASSACDEAMTALNCSSGGLDVNAKNPS